MSKSGSAMEQIQALSNERQGLWRLAGKQKLNEGQRERLHDLHGIITRLWDTHRCEVAGRSAVLRLPEDFLYQEWAADFNDRQSLSGGTKGRLAGSEGRLVGLTTQMERLRDVYQEETKVNKHAATLRELLQMQKRYQDAQSPLKTVVQLS